MKKYLIGLLVSVLVLTGCEKIDFNFSNDEGTENVDITTPTESATDPIEPTESTTEPLAPMTPTAPVVSPDPLPSIVTNPIVEREMYQDIAKEWYLRIVVEDTTNNMKTAGTQLGQIESADAVTKHTLKAIAPFGSTYLDVVFVNPVGVDAGSYKSNFHTAGTDEDSWEFTVKSYDNNATMILSWRGLYVLAPYVDGEGRERYREYKSTTNPLLSYMTLLDVATGTEIDILANGTVNEYVFTMDGSLERVFRWTLKDSSMWTQAKVSTLKHVTKPAIILNEERLKKLQIKALRKDAKAKPDALKKKRLESLDMMTPPTFEILVK